MASTNESHDEISPQENVPERGTPLSGKETLSESGSLGTPKKMVQSPAVSSFGSPLNVIKSFANMLNRGSPISRSVKNSPLRSQTSEDKENHGKSVDETSKAHDSKYEAIAALDELTENEKWVERTSIITKLDHDKYEQYAREIVSEIVADVKTPEQSKVSDSTSNGGDTNKTPKPIQSSSPSKFAKKDENPNISQSLMTFRNPVPIPSYASDSEEEDYRSAEQSFSSTCSNREKNNSEGRELLSPFSPLDPLSNKKTNADDSISTLMNAIGSLDLESARKSIMPSKDTVDKDTPTKEELENPVERMNSTQGARSPSNLDDTLKEESLLSEGEKSQSNVERIGNETVVISSNSQETSETDENVSVIKENQDEPAITFTKIDDNAKESSKEKEDESRANEQQYSDTVQKPFLLTESLNDDQLLTSSPITPMLVDSPVINDESTKPDKETEAKFPLEISAPEKSEILQSNEAPCETKDSRSSSEKICDISKDQEMEKESSNKVNTSKDRHEEHMVQILLLQQQLIEKDKTIVGKDKEIGLWKEKHAKIEKSNNHLLEIVGEYEKTISEIVGERDRERAVKEIEKEKLIKEKEQLAEDLAAAERSFNDYHRKYERLKETVTSFKENEDNLKAKVEEWKKKSQKAEQRYELLKSHAEGKLEEANVRVESTRKHYEGELLKTEAMLRKTEMKVTSLEQTLEQKAKENDELTKICDELIAKVGM